MAMAKVAFKPHNNKLVLEDNLVQVVSQDNNKSKDSLGINNNKDKIHLAKPHARLTCSMA